MAITWADVTPLAPELSTVAVGTQTAILAAVAGLIDEDVIGDNYALAAAYLAAHIATLGTQQAAVAGLAGGVIPSSTKVGPLEQTYTAAGGSSSGASAMDYTSTAYGRMYLLLSGVPRVSLGVVA